MLSTQGGGLSNFMAAPLNLQKYDHPQHIVVHTSNHHKPTAIATAVIRVQVPECNSSGMIRQPESSPALVSVSTNSSEKGSHSPFMVPQPAAMYSNVIVMNKKAKPQLSETGGCPSSNSYAKSYPPVMEPTVASSSSHSMHGSSSSSNYKGEPELNIGMPPLTFSAQGSTIRRRRRMEKVISQNSLRG